MSLAAAISRDISRLGRAHCLYYPLSRSIEIYLLALSQNLSPHSSATNPVLRFDLDVGWIETMFRARDTYILHGDLLGWQLRCYGEQKIWVCNWKTGVVIWVNSQAVDSCCLYALTDTQLIAIPSHKRRLLSHPRCAPRRRSRGFASLCVRT